jgi:hypothetical protein
MCPTSFRPKWGFIKSIPGEGFAATQDPAEGGRSASQNPINNKNSILTFYNTRSGCGASWDQKKKLAEINKKASGFSSKKDTVTGSDMYLKRLIFHEQVST